MSSLPPLLFDASGPVATPPATLQANLISLVEEAAPGYTAALPGALIEDLSSTSVGVLSTIDQARVDAINNVTPYASNQFILDQQGAMLGIPQDTPTNANADVVFSGTAGFVIPAGWLVSDGTSRYVVQAPGTIVGAGGHSAQTTVVATNSNVFPIPAGSINQLVTLPPVGITLTVTNPQAGVPAAAAETTDSYRSRILDGYKVAVTGSNTYLKTLLRAVVGVSQRLISVRQSGPNWIVICGGGDVYAVALAVYQGVSDIGLLAGSSIDTTRNVYVSIYDVPDTYNVVFVNPPAQTVTAAVTWNTTLPDFTAGGAVDAYIIQATASYINSIIVGQPMNLLTLNQMIQASVAPVLDPSNLTTLEYVITVNGVVVGPTAGTWLIPSDPESYFAVSPSGVTSAQG